MRSKHRRCEGKEGRTTALELVTLYVKAATSMARGKAFIAIAAVLLFGSGQDIDAQTYFFL